MFKKIGLSVAALLAAVGIAYAGGAFQGLPLVGDPGADICVSFGNNSVCNQYLPAGPSAVPPTATLPADVNPVGVAQNPATIAIPAGLTGATVLDAAPLTAASITVPVGTAKLILNPAGTIAALTVLLPPLSNTDAAGNIHLISDGQEFFIHTSQTVSTLTVTAGTGTTLTPSITTVTAAAPVKLIYNGQAKAWQTF